MAKNVIKITENDLHNIIERSVNYIIKEEFDDDYQSAVDKHMNKGGMWGMELKNPEGEWEYGDVTYDPNTNTMSCMGISIEVDKDFSVDENLQALYDKLVESGYDAE